MQIFYSDLNALQIKILKLSEVSVEHYDRE